MNTGVESEFPWTGRVIANIDFNLGRSKYARVCCSLPEGRGGEKKKTKSIRGIGNVFEKRMYFRDAFTFRVVEERKRERMIARTYKYGGKGISLENGGYHTDDNSPLG